MNVRLFFCIAMGVFVAHLGVFMLWTHLRPAPKAPATPKQNFIVRSQTVTDRATGEKTTYREITVGTGFATTPGEMTDDGTRMTKKDTPDER